MHRARYIIFVFPNIYLETMVISFDLIHDSVFWNGQIVFDIVKVGNVFKSSLVYNKNIKLFIEQRYNITCT